MLGLVGKKIGMTSMLMPKARMLLVRYWRLVLALLHISELWRKTVIPQSNLGMKRRKEKKTNSALMGHFKKAKTSPKRKLVEIRDFNNDVNLGDEVNLELFGEGDFIDVVGTSKGKGFQGVVKRHGFAGVGGQTHGQHNRGRAPGSLGAASTPSRVFKGIKMAGRMGGARVKLQNLEILKLDVEKNLVVVKGAIPGARGSYVILEK